MRPVHSPSEARIQTPAPVSSAEPATELLIIVRRANGKMEPFGTLTIKEENLPLYTEALEQVAESQPKDTIELGRPGTRLIVTAVDTKDPDHVGSSEDRFEVGEVVTIPEFVSFINIWFPKFSAPLVRYYIDKLRQPCTKCGYTVQSLDQFLRDLKGPAARDFQDLADAHVAWATSAKRTPFQ